MSCMYGMPRSSRAARLVLSMFLLGTCSAAVQSTLAARKIGWWAISLAAFGGLISLWSP